MEVIPSIDLRGGQIVRLQQGDYARQISYALDPVQTAVSFADAGANWMHIVDLDGAKSGRIEQIDLIRAITQAVSGRLSVQAGGGVRSTDDVERVLSAGVARVVVGTKAIEQWDWFEGLARQARLAQKLVLALDARTGVVATHAWTSSSGRTAAEIAQTVSDWPLAGILYTDVAKDGMLQGANIDYTRQLVAAGNVPVIASGGVGDLNHLDALIATGCWGVILGRSLHDGKILLTEAIARVQVR